MNCKPGDLAMVVAPYVPEGRGAFVVVSRLANSEERLNGHDVFTCCRGAWVVNGWVRGETGWLVGPQVVIGDECLRPIGGTEGDDATLTWAGRPQDQKVPA